MDIYYKLLQLSHVKQCIGGGTINIDTLRWPPENSSSFYKNVKIKGEVSLYRGGNGVYYTKKQMIPESSIIVINMNLDHLDHQ